MTRKSALVAGGGGFLGSHVCDLLREKGYHVYCLDNFGSGRPRNVSHARGSQEFTVLRDDVRTASDLPVVDEVYHLASRASPTEFTEFPVEIALANTQGTRNLLDHARRCDARMLFASTSEVYGDPERHPQPESYNGNVNVRGPRGCYDESKRFGETLTVAYHDEFDLDVRTVRIFNTYGPRMRATDGRVVPTFVTQALRGEDLTVYGDGSQTRSFAYVDDTVRALWAVMQEDSLGGEVVNVGNDDETTIADLAETVIGLTETGSDVTHEPLPEDDPVRRKPDLTRARRTLEWEPEVPLEDGLVSTLEYFETEVETTRRSRARAR